MHLSLASRNFILQLFYFNVFLQTGAHTKVFCSSVYLTVNQLCKLTHSCVQS